MNLLDVLRAARGGGLLHEADTALAELVQAVDRSGKAGRLTVEITVKKVSRAGAMNVLGKCKLTAPGELEETLMFATPEGRLLSEDPRQAKLDLKTLDGGSVAPLKTVG